MATVGSVLASLSPLLSLVDGDLDVELSEVVILGPGDEAAHAPGALVVCLADVTPKTAAAIVVKGQPPALDLPVLVAEPSLPWNHLLHLLEAVVADGGDTAGDLFTFANAVAAAVGGAVTIEDVDRHVLAYSSLDQPVDAARQQAILGRVVPQFSRNDEIYANVYRSNAVVSIPADGEVLPRLAVAVRSGPEVLGSIWTVDGGNLDRGALGDASRHASLHLLRARSLGHVERRSRGEILRSLLDSRSSPQLAGARLGIEATQPVTIIAFGLPAPATRDPLGCEAVADLIQLQAAAVAARASVLVELGTAYVAVPGDVPRAALRELAARVIERGSAMTGGPLSAGVGATVTSLSDITRSRLDADGVLLATPACAVGLVEDCMPQVVLLELSRHLAATSRLWLAAVERMLADDAREGTAYAETVLTYLSSNGAVGQAAHSIYVHPNTFRYRLQRARERYALDLDDPDTRLVTWLMLRTRSR